MSPQTQTLSPAAQLQATSPAARLASIDIFRGLTMAVMIFVNDLADVHGLPWWTYHAKANIDVMTYVDLVYPFFLFIIGLSIPLAIRQRLKRGASIKTLWMHVIERSFSLIVLGYILANAEHGDRARMLINPYAWAILALAGAALFLSTYDANGRHARLHFWLRMAGLALLIVMLALFRRTSNGHAAWFDWSYPEILGLIGYTYFAICVLYIPTRRWIWAPFAWFVALLVLNIACAARWITLISTQHGRLYLWPFGNGAMACITMGGIATSVIFLGAHRWQKMQQKILMGVGFGLLTLAAGWLLVPLGISKIRATPTWSLWSVGFATLAFTALYWICDVRRHVSWAFFVRPAGNNTLLTYLLPDFYYFILAWAGISYFDRHLNYGWPGAVRSVVFTGAMLALSALMTRWKIRLQL
jgi:predicted acyltransferase